MSSPMKRKATAEEDIFLGAEEFSEEAVEIDCGVVDANNEEVQCRICYDNTQTEDNPLLDSC